MLPARERGAAYFRCLYSHLKPLRSLHITACGRWSIAGRVCARVPEVRRTPGVTATFFSPFEDGGGLIHRTNQIKPQASSTGAALHTSSYSTLSSTVPRCGPSLVTLTLAAKASVSRDSSLARSPRHRPLTISTSPPTAGITWPGSVSASAVAISVGEIGHEEEGGKARVRVIRMCVCMYVRHARLST